MIIPVRCFTCGNILADKYQMFLDNKSKDITYFNENNKIKTKDGELLDKLGLHKTCCRTVMMTHVDIS